MRPGHFARENGLIAKGAVRDTSASMRPGHFARENRGVLESAGSTMVGLQ